MGFVQADPIRAPARAQDLILRHRVKGYRAGDLERHYESLGVEEDVFINYGFVTRELQTLMHPRPVAVRGKKIRVLLDFVTARGAVHPREVDAHFSHGSVTNYWGGSSNATTHLLNEMHYRGMLRVVRRERGVRVYGAHQHEADPREITERIDRLVDAAVHIYAPLPSKSLSVLVRRLRYAVPQWRGQLTRALQRAKKRLAHARVDEVDWYWPADEDPLRCEVDDEVRLLAPFDPIVWDRERFEMLWGWAYRFEAYTPVAKRKLGYYALPMLWRDRVIGWGNLSVKDGALESSFGYVSEPRDRGFRKGLGAELKAVSEFLGIL